jgi:hypothetical protein
MGSEPSFYLEIHRIRSTWIAFAVLAMIVVACVALERSTSSDTPYLLLMIAFFLIVLSLSLVCLSMVLVVNTSEIVLSLTPMRLVILKLKAKEVASFNLRRVRKPPREPFDHDTKCFMTRWSHGLLIRTSEGGKVLIGTPHPEDLMRAVWKLKKRRKSTSVFSSVDA